MNIKTQPTLTAFNLFIFAFLCAVSIFMPRLFAFVPIVMVFIIFLFQLRARINFSDLLDIPKPIYIGLFFFMLIIFSSFFWSIDAENSLKRLIKFLPLLFFGLLFLMMINAYRIKISNQSILIISSAMLILSGLLVAEFAASYPVYKMLNPDNIAVHPNIMGAAYNHIMVALTLFFFPLYVLTDRLENHKTAMRGAMILTLIILLYLGTSETAFLAFLIALPVLFFMPVDKKFIWSGLAILFSLLIMFSPWLANYAFEETAEYLAAHPQFNQSGAHILQRLEIYDFVARYILQNPMTGYGIEAGRIIKDFDQQFLYHRFEGILHPHNFALQIWLEFGLIGAAFAALMIQRVLLGLFTAHKKWSPLIIRALTAYLFAVLCIFSFGYGIWQGWLWGVLFTSFAVFIIALPKNQFGNNNT